MTKLALSNGNLDVLDISGRRPALVLLHEGIGSVGLWRDFPRALAQATGSRTVAFSRYGHGYSDPPPNPRTPSFMHEEADEILPEVLASLDIDNPVLIGHSDGGSIALIYAAHHRATAVVAIAPHVFVEPICLREIRNAKSGYEQGGLRDRMARHHADPDTAFYGWNNVWLDPAFESWDIRPLLREVTAPLLLIQGTRDQYGTMAQLDAIERAAATPRVQRLHLDCGHAPQTECPEETLAAIQRFVAERADASLN